MRLRAAGGGLLACGALVALLLLTGPTPVDVSLGRADTSFLAPGVDRGFNVTAYQPEGFSGDGVAKAVAVLRDTGSTHAAFVPTYYQPSPTADAVAPDPQKTVTDASLEHGLKAARDAGLQTVLKPHVDVLDGSFRGLIRPADNDAWFASYTRMVVHYATLAQAAGVTTFVVGDELTGVQGDRERWAAVIAAVRAVFKGRLTYAANWDPGFQAVPFWDLLDAVGIDEYRPLATPTDTPTVAQLLAAWAPLVADLKAAHDTTGKPVLLTEIGYPARRGATASPATEDTGAAADPQAQARAYEAAYRALRGLPFLAGIYWWELAADARSHDTFGDTAGYGPAGLPAEAVVRDFSG